MSATTRLLLSMSEIASLAQVRRPVVTVWRARAAGSDHPFPSPVTKRGTQLLFDAEQIAAWLEQTGRGNNTRADGDVAAHAARPESTSIDSVTALLALRASIGRPLAGLSRDELLDEADGVDPDDAAFFSEVDETRDLTGAALYVEELVDAAYGEAPAFERVLAADRRTTSPTTPGPVLTAAGIRFVASIAGGLVSARTTEVLPMLVDSTGSAAEVIIDLTRAEEFAELVVSIGHTHTDDASADELRMLRRRLLVHSITHVENQIGREAGPKQHLAIFGSAPSTSDAATILDAIDDLAVSLDDSQLALVVAPSSVLTDGGLGHAADDLRSGILRSGQVRAIVRLPAGLRAGMSRQSLTVWVLGSAHPAVDLADRWTMVADLSALPHVSGIDDDLVSDLVASLSDHPTVRAHAFRFARPVFTRQLLARRGSLVQPSAGGPRPQDPTAPVEGTLQVERLLDELALVRMSVTPTATDDRATRNRTRTIAQRIDSRELRYLPGNRLPADLVNPIPATRGRVTAIGPDEILGELPIGARSVDRLRFAAEQPSGRLSEPGDVIFVTSPRPRAIVDREGLSVVQYPARILRIQPDGDEQLLPDVVAFDVNLRETSDTAWRTWTSRGVAPHNRSTFEGALDVIRGERAAALARVGLLDKLETALTTAVTRGDLTVTTTPDTAEPEFAPDFFAPPAKGHH